MAALIPFVPIAFRREAVGQHKSNGVVAYIDQNIFDLRLTRLIQPFHGAYLLKNWNEQEARSFGEIPYFRLSRPKIFNPKRDER
jgi:hypothetical protein